MDDGQLITVLGLQTLISKFAADTFGPNREDAAWKKLFIEIGETLENPDDPSEWADVFIILLDLATMYNVDVGAATMAKMEVNRRRVWTTSKTGVMQHVPGAEKLIVPEPESKAAIRVICEGGPWAGRSPPEWYVVGMDEGTTMFAPGRDDMLVAGPAWANEHGHYTKDRVDTALGGGRIHYFRWEHY